MNSEGEIKWNVVCEYMFSHDPTSCKNKWDQLKQKQDERIIDILAHSTSQKSNSDYNYGRKPFFCMIFTEEQEETLFTNIKSMPDDHQLVTKNTIS